MISSPATKESVWKLLTISKRSSGLVSNAVFVNSATSFAVHVTPSVWSWCVPSSV